MTAHVLSKRTSLALLTVLFFVWGFVHNLDPILIPHLKNCFDLSIMQSSLVDSSVFIAYFVMAIPAGILIKRFGYQWAIVFGLILFASGSFLFIPAAEIGYSFFLFALFVVACGLAVLETAANPYTANLGQPNNSEKYLNFAQSFNGLAATLAPIIGATLILSPNSKSEHMSADAVVNEVATVKMPYTILGCVIVVIALVFLFVKLPVLNNNNGEKGIDLFRAWRHRQLIRALVAQFFYVGAQVCVFSFFILYAVSAAGISNLEAANYLGWGCGMLFMIGRFVGTALMRFVQPAKLLLIYSLTNMVLSLAAVQATGMFSVGIVIAIAFFMSIMFPTIFSLGINGLDTDTELGSSLMIMSIIGGAILPLLFGYIGDVTGNIQNGYWVPLCSFGFIAWFSFKTHSQSQSTDNSL